MNEATNAYTLADFQQQVAVRYQFIDWNDFIITALKSSDGAIIVDDYLSEAAEAYAAYRFEQGRKAALEALKITQSCPVCNGQGVVLLNGRPTATYTICTTCNPQKISASFNING